MAKGTAQKVAEARVRDSEPQRQAQGLPQQVRICQLVVGEQAEGGGSTCRKRVPVAWPLETHGGCRYFLLRCWASQIGVHRKL